MFAGQCTNSVLSGRYYLRKYYGVAILSTKTQDTKTVIKLPSLHSKSPVTMLTEVVVVEVVGGLYLVPYSTISFKN